jgi:Putative metal-binding motif
MIEQANFCERDCAGVERAAWLERLAVGVMLGLVWLLAAAPASGAVPGDCRELGTAITEHSCFHSEFGPFTTVLATAGTSATADTPNVNPVHTEYRIGLTGEYSVVTYTPARSGTWAVLLGKDVPLQVLTRKGEALPSLLDQATTGCAALPVLQVFELVAKTQYRLVFGPTPDETVVAVIEYIDDFLTQNGRDDDGDGFGSKTEVVVTPCSPPAGFAPNTRDCDDTDPQTSPAAVEVCDGADQNCNGVADDVGLLCRAGLGACRVEGKLACAVSSAEAECSATPPPASEEACNGLDDDCNGKIDDAPDLCPEPERPRCVRSGMSASCGCQLDLDCGARTSGRVCNTVRAVCEDGCSTTPGRNGCAVGQACNEETARCEAVLNSGGAGGGSSDSGEGGAGNQPTVSEPEPSEGGEAGSGLVGGGGSATRGGCGCRVAQGSPATAPLAAVGALLGLTLVRRRRGAWARRASAAMLASSLLGCGGRVQDVAASGGSPALPAGPEGGRVSAGASATGGSGMGGTAGAAAGCQRALGEEPVLHACSHTTNGPFVPVVAGGELPPPDVSDLHHTYEVQVVGPGARLLYRAQREGDHAFMTDRSVTLQLSRAGRPQSASPSVGVDGCAHLAWATVYALEPDTEYELLLLESSPEVDLFVEHLAAFGSGAWVESCAGYSAPDAG